MVYSREVANFSFGTGIVEVKKEDKKSEVAAREEIPRMSFRDSSALKKLVNILVFRVLPLMIIFRPL